MLSPGSLSVDIAVHIPHAIISRHDAPYIQATIQLGAFDMSLSQQQLSQIVFLAMCVNEINRRCLTQP